MDVMASIVARPVVIVVGSAAESRILDLHCIEILLSHSFVVLDLGLQNMPCSNLTKVMVSEKDCYAGNLEMGRQRKQNLAQYMLLVQRPSFSLQFASSVSGCKIWPEDTEVKERPLHQ